MSAYVNFQSDAASVWKMLRAVSGKRAFDIGANGGLVSRTLARRFDEVIACEPAMGVLLRPHPEQPRERRTVEPRGVRHARRAQVAGDDAHRPAWGVVHRRHARRGVNTSGTGRSMRSRSTGCPRRTGCLTSSRSIPKATRFTSCAAASETLRSGPTFVIECHSAAKGEEVQDDPLVVRAPSPDPLPPLATGRLPRSVWGTTGSRHPRTKSHEHATTGRSRTSKPTNSSVLSRSEE